MPTDWIAEERGFRGALEDFARLARRARARRLFTLGLTLLLTAAVVIRAASKDPIYTSEVVFRVLEADFENQTASTPNKALRSFIMNVVFSNELLIDLMKRHHLGGTRFKLSPIDSAESLRDEDIDVRVWRNYFLERRTADDPARSARLSIEFAHRDPQVAYEVVRELAAAVTEQSERSTKAAAQRELAQMEDTVAAARAEVVDTETELALDELKMLRVRPLERAALTVEQRRLQQLLKAKGGELQDYEKKRDDYKLRVEMERHQLGIHFEVIEAPRPALLKTGRPQRLALLAVILFLLLLPLVALGVGAADSRIYDTDDLRRLGVEPLGHVPAFPGDDVGSLEQRLDRSAKR